MESDVSNINAVDLLDTIDRVRTSTNLARMLACGISNSSEFCRQIQEAERTITGDTVLSKNEFKKKFLDNDDVTKIIKDNALDDKVLKNAVKSVLKDDTVSKMLTLDNVQKSELNNLVNSKVDEKLQGVRDQLSKDIIQNIKDDKNLKEELKTDIESKLNEWKDTIKTLSNKFEGYQNDVENLVTQDQIFGLEEKILSDIGLEKIDGQLSDFEEKMNRFGVRLAELMVLRQMQQKPKLKNYNKTSKR